MKILLRLAILTFYFLIINELKAQISETKFESLSSKEGLSNNRINCLMQDKQGFIWIGTFDGGLNKYDGYKFITYTNNPKDNNSISSNTINDLFEDSHGYIWATTTLGLNRFDPAKEMFINYKHDPQDTLSIGADFCRKMIQTDNENLWITTYGNGLDRLNLKTGLFKHYRNIPGDSTSIGHNTVLTIYADKKGNYWVGHDYGLARMFINNEKVWFKNYSLKQSDPEQSVWSIYEDRENNLWIGLLGAGLLVFDREKNVFEKEEKINQFINVNVYSILEDSKKNLWLATYDGLNKRKFQANSFSIYKNQADNPLSINNNTIWNILEDNSGIVWFGTNSGINKFNRNNEFFLHYRNNQGIINSLSNNVVLSFLEDDSGGIWIGTRNGLNYLNQDRNNIQVWLSNPNSANSLTNNHITDIEIDKFGMIWTSTWGFGLDRYDPKTKKYLHFKNILNDTTSLAENNIECIYKTKDQKLWFGTLKGLACWDDASKKFTNYKKDPQNPKSLGSNFIFTMLEDSKGNFWLGTRRGGLDLFDRSTGTFIHYIHNEEDTNSISNNNINSIFEDTSGNLWIGTNGGLNIFNYKNQTFKAFRLYHGLRSEAIYGILEDKTGKLWLSTNKGIIRFNPHDTTFTNFDVQDGLQSNDFLPHSCLMTSKGEFLFGGINGFNLFYPDSIKSRQFAPPVVITDFQILNKPVKVYEIIDGEKILSEAISKTNGIKLSYKSYIFSLEFAALDYGCPEKIKYAYMMQGLDKDWIYTDSKRRFATYINLEGGSYTFRVKATNSDGVWNEKPTELKITIIPPFWKTLWFKFLVVIIIIASAFTWYRQRIKSIEEQKRTLEKLVEERTTEVVRQNHEIQFKNIELEQQKEEILAQRDDIIDKSVVLKSQKEEIENQRDQIEQSFKTVKLLNQIGQEITRTLSLEVIIETTYYNVNSLMDVGAFAIGLFNPKTNTIDFKYGMENGQKLPIYFHKLEDPNKLSIWCYQNRKELIISDYQNDYSRYISTLKAPSVGQLPKSLIYVPLEIKNRIIGVITVQSFKTKAYTSNHLDIIKNLSLYTAIAIENSNTYKEIVAKNTEIEIINKELEHRNIEIQQQAEEIIASNQALEFEQEQTMSSIRYAKTIQNSILPSIEQIQKIFECFIIYRPRDIVSGDFYWFAEITNHSFSGICLAVVDCTGHGVPGAFMSMIGSRLLSEIILERKVTNPAAILSELDSNIRLALRQEHTDNDDGMDICLCCIDFMPNEIIRVIFSGAKRPLYFFCSQTQELSVYKGTRRPIGGKFSQETAFMNIELNLKKNDILYLTTDGLIDQNSLNRKKFGTTKLVNFLASCAHLSMNDQKIAIENVLDSYQGNESQRDDITIMGLKT
jgi:ligand-binding sensor domain-containing protein/serine phosphatase RsbU (regulator of sigma subunit)